MGRLKTIIMIAVLLWLAGGPAWAYREAFTAQQREQLAKVQNVLVDVIALTDKGPVDAGPLRDTVTSRMESVGYTVTTDRNTPSDVTLKVKCEQRKTWEGTTTLGGDADLPDAPSRVWKGPACQLNYLLGGTKIPWQKEVRTDFEDAVAAAQAANAGDPGAYAMASLRDKLQQYEFPLLLAAEWGQTDRLLKVLDDPRSSQLRKLKTIALLGELMDQEALPKLQEALKDKDLKKQAIIAMGNVGKDGIPTLVEIMKTSKDPEVQAEAAKALGHVGGLHGDPRVVPPLLGILDKPGLDIRVQTEVVWSLGKMPDKQSIEPLRALYAKVLKIRDPENRQLQQLKEALNWSIKQCDVDGHIS